MFIQALPQGSFATKDSDAALTELIRRYYAGEARLWADIRSLIDAELWARGISVGAYHIRLRRDAEGYDILIEEAAAYANDP